MSTGIGFPCPCCGFLTRSESDYGTFEICPVCGWEDDYVQQDDPDYGGGANTISLNEARESYRKTGAISESKTGRTRPPRANEILMNLEAFCDWCRKKSKELAATDYVAELTVHDSDGMSHSACLDVAAGKVMARITFWKDGYADLEILDVSTGENIYYRHFERVSDFELDFKEFINHSSMIKSGDPDATE